MGRRRVPPVHGGGLRRVRVRYTHEAEERNKIKFLIRFNRVELKKLILEEMIYL